MPHTFIRQSFKILYEILVSIFRAFSHVFECQNVIEFDLEVRFDNFYQLHHVFSVR